MEENFDNSNVDTPCPHCGEKKELYSGKPKGFITLVEEKVL
jgi:hypothetical protein